MKTQYLVVNKNTNISTCGYLLKVCQTIVTSTCLNKLQVMFAYPLSSCFDILAALI